MDSENENLPDKEEVEAELLAVTLRAFCPQCGGEVKQSGRGRPRKFCSAECLRLWRNKNQCPPLRRTAQKRICPVCGKEFLTDRLKSRPKTYCSRACANRARKKTEVSSDGNEISSDNEISGVDGKA